MTKRVCFITLLIMLAAATVLGTVAQARVKAIVASEAEQAVMGWINAARDDPRGAIAALGRDPDDVLRSCPELGPVFDEGLDPLGFDGNLYLAARLRSKAMAMGSEAMEASRDEMKRYLVTVGFRAARRSELKASVAFVNFIDSKKAARRMFDQVLAQELSPGAERHILSPIFTRVGVSLRASQVNINGKVYNGYVMVMEFARELMSLAEAQVLALINQARSNPLAAATQLGIDLGQVASDSWLGRLGEGLVPLAVSPVLYEAAEAHGRDMLERYYFSHESPEGYTPLERAEELGYDGDQVGEWLSGVGAPEALLPIDVLDMMWRARAKAELEERSGQRLIFGDEYREVGVCLSEADLGEDETGPTALCRRQFALVGEFGSGTQTASPRVIGVVFRDLNGDGLYGPGEGLAGVQVSVRGDYGYKVDLFTNQAGGFSVALARGDYRLRVFGPCGVLKADVQMGQRSQWLAFAIPAGGGCGD